MHEWTPSNSTWKEVFREFLKGHTFRWILVEAGILFVVLIIVLVYALLT